MQRQKLRVMNSEWLFFSRKQVLDGGIIAVWNTNSIFG